MRSILAAVAAPTIARCIATSAVTAQTPKRGGMLEFAVVAEPPSDDCHGSTTFALIDPVAPHDSLLVKFDGKEYPRVVQDLVES
jgi:peptide/nickel transport system substrate-binding protein